MVAISVVPRQGMTFIKSWAFLFSVRPPKNPIMKVLASAVMAGVLISSKVYVEGAPNTNSSVIVPNTNPI